MPLGHWFGGWLWRAVLCTGMPLQTRAGRGGSGRLDDVEAQLGDVRVRLEEIQLSLTEVRLQDA